MTVSDARSKGDVAKKFHTVVSYIRENLPENWELRMTFRDKYIDIAVVNESADVEYGEKGSEVISLVGILDYVIDLSKEVTHYYHKQS